MLFSLFFDFKKVMSTTSPSPICVFPALVYNEKWIYRSDRTDDKNGRFVWPKKDAQYRSAYSVIKLDTVMGRQRIFFLINGNQFFSHFHIPVVLFGVWVISAELLRCVSWKGAADDGGIEKLWHGKGMQLYFDAGGLKNMSLTYKYSDPDLLQKATRPSWVRSAR